MTGSRAVCILSPPRSGSSLTARIINRLGVYLGSGEDFESSSVHNPRGYWEHLAIQKINEEILMRMGYDYSRAGADWSNLPDLPDGWEADSRLNDLRETAMNVVQDNFSQHAVWGWKDPRTCFTLPFWQSILPRLQCIILVRNPVDVAHSIERFLDCSFERGLYMWLMYLDFAFRHTAGQDRLLIRVEAWTDDWAVELERLALFLGNPGLADDADVQDAVRILVDKNLWHHRTSMQAVLMVNELYGQISAGGEFGEGDAQKVFQGALDCLGSEARGADAARKDRDWSQWQAMLDLASKELDRIIPPGSNLILVDDDCIGTEMINGRKITPFIERGGQYYGQPPDDVVAVNEFNRLHEAGAAYMAFVWPAHWWLDYFPGLNDHLRSRFRCVLQNDRLVVFDLQS